MGLDDFMALSDVDDDGKKQKLSPFLTNAGRDVGRPCKVPQALKADMAMYRERVERDGAIL